MVIGVLKEPDYENRVALLPEHVKPINALGCDIVVERGAGARSFAADEAYAEAGAAADERSSVISKADLLISIQPVSTAELNNLGNNAAYMSILNPLGSPDRVNEYLDQNITSFSLDNIPRTTRAQSMDILSSMATVAGYKAVLVASTHALKFFPMLMTAAGSIQPARVLVLGAGVAGLMAIATAKRLGAVVEAFDVRAAAKEEVLSLGAKFIEVEGARDEAAAGGYAVEQTEEFLQKQKKLVQEHAAKSDVIITTAQIPGRKAPVLVTKETVRAMKKGAVIVDLAASTGGNCELTQNNEVVREGGVTIIGDSNLPSSVPADASKMFGKNIINLLKVLVVEGSLSLNFEDDIIRETCVTHNGEVISERIKKSMTANA